MSEKLYNSDDVEILAEQIINNWENHNTSGGYRCNYCFGHGWQNEKPTKVFEGFNHSLDCPVFVAQDVLTKPD